MNVDNELQRKIQLKILEIVLEIDRICEKHNIKYYLAYGTAIGAVRHSGFIPWDDDADIQMFKEDFIKFKEVCKTELGDKYFFQDWDTDKGYKSFLPKIRINNTAFVEGWSKDWDMHQGIYVDIFILDECPDNKKIQDLNIKIRKYTEFTRRGIYNKENTKSILKNIIRPLVKNNTILNIWKALIYNNCKKDDKLCIDINDFGNIFPKDVFGTPRKMDFEGYKLSVPEKVEDYLTYYYGDFMTLPPEEKRVSHHNIVYIDLESSYKSK